MRGERGRGRGGREEEGRGGPPLSFAECCQLVLKGCLSCKIEVLLCEETVRVHYGTWQAC